ncbi:extensin family protein [Mesobacterium sp. TK19101]|uniref:Extensin family protein n=1 Tax=Mesobacterium hydrothermale TaxID=3111907 RepID=A0ABU6HBQ2_9RHOB|nr:extensin family protein [Mesobacterium sp. TK19101]MEC3859903.1 extensin family protein [Mesobacterium sp. TK19101]
MKRLIAAVLLLATPAFAAAPEASLRPVARTVAPVISTRSVPNVRPALRPEGLVPVAPLPAMTPYMQAPTSEDLAANTAGVAVVPASMGHARSLRPMARPGVIVEQAMAKRRALNRGKVCGDRDLQGEEIGFVPGKIAGCGVENAVKLRSVSGIPLSQQAIMDCTTAKALKTWVDRGLVPAVGTRGRGIAEIKVAAHYACRTRNNQPGAKISEHGRGRAIDISGVRLKDGTTVTVLNDWNNRTYGRILRRAHERACGIFGTVLGPGSDGYHEDHFHFDTARYRSGPYCR